LSVALGQDGVGNAETFYDISCKDRAVLARTKNDGNLLRSAGKRELMVIYIMWRGRSQLKDSIFLGQRLKTITNEYVTIEKIEDRYIYVSYKNKTYKREKNIIGKKLFIIQDEIKNSADEAFETPSKGPSKDINSSSRETCKNCMEMRKGECIGKQSICEFFRYAPNISKEELDNWPKYGDATYFRMKYGKN
jgi:hypothetical protein